MNATRVCSVDECDGKTKAHGLCNMHYLRLRAHGHPGNAAPRIFRSPTGICSYPGCGREHHSNSFCSTHARQVRRGDPLSEIEDRSLFDAPIETRMAAYTDKADGCWEWRGQLERGYGILSVDGKKQYAHRLAYELSFGPIPDGLHIDHKCRNGSCVRPDHLHAVTVFENAQNKTIQVNNSTGFRGVSKQVKRSGKIKYVVEVSAKGVKYRGGSFDTAEEANVAAVALRNMVQTNNRKDWE